MKNLTKIFMAVAVAMFAFSCVTDTTDDAAVKVGGKTTLAISLGGGNRTTLGEAENGVYPITWAEGDQITVNGETSEPLAAADADTANAVFTFNAELSAPYCVAYPAAEANQVVFAAEQEYAEGTFANGAATMYGYARNGNITLNHLTGVLKIGVVCGEDVDIFDAPVIQSVKISTIDRAPIAGAFNINFETGAVTATAEATSVINYSIDEKLSQDPTYIHVAVPAGVYNELYVTLEDSNGGVMYKTVTAGDNEPLAAGKVREFTTPIVYEATGVVEQFTIKDYSSLLAFKEVIEAADATYSDKNASADDKAAAAVILAKNAVFAGDIDMKDIAWAPISATNYSGTLIGNGFAINDLGAPLFNVTSASFKGLHLNINITETETLNTGGFARKVSAVVENTPTVFENCIVKGSITINNGTDTNTSLEVNDIGGFAGRVYGTNFINCTNYANITIEQAQKAGQSSNMSLVVGGIVGFTGTAQGCFANFTNCTNKGNIVWSEGDEKKIFYYLGGLVGIYRGAGSVATFDNCSNSGDITVNADTRGGDAGGFIAYTNGTASSPKTFTFTGTTSNSGDIYIGGIHTASNQSRYGGIIAYPSEAITIEFQGPVINSGSITINTPDTIYGVRIGGILGVPDYGNHITFKDTVINTKEADISVSGKVGSGEIYIGGIVGYITLKNCTLTFEKEAINEGAITVNSNPSTPSVHVGGLIGVAKSGTVVTFNSSATNAKGADITINGKVSTISHVGGIIGWLNEATTKKQTTTDEATGETKEETVIDKKSRLECKGDVTNAGAITINGENKEIHVGGISGSLSVNIESVFNNVTNTKDGDITVSGSVSSLFWCGGITGRLGTASEAAYTTIPSNKTLINEGDITLSAAFRSTVAVGGYLGSGRNASTWLKNRVKIINRGKIRTTPEASFAGTTNIGGIVGYYNGNSIYNYNSSYTGSKAINEGEILCEGTTSSDFKVGGIMGENYNSTNSLSAYISVGNITVAGKHTDATKYFGVGGSQGSTYSETRKLKNQNIFCNIIACSFADDGTCTPCPNVGMATGFYSAAGNTPCEATKVGGSIATMATKIADGQYTATNAETLTATNYFDYVVGARQSLTEYAGVTLLTSRDELVY